MKGLKILVMIAALVVVVGAVSDAWAACSPGRFFVSRGQPLGNTNVNFSTEGTLNDSPADNQICRMWDSDDASNSNSGLVGPNFGSLCPCTSWWKQQGTTAIKLINGFIGGADCLIDGCPADNLTLVVEDYAAGAGPGLDEGSTAYYMGLMVFETPASGRWWDYGLIDGVTAPTTFPMVQFPDLVITGSNRGVNSVGINYQNLDQTNNVHSWDTPSGTVFPTASVITEWQLVKATATGDPGRLRSNGWVTIDSTPYEAGGASATFDVPCTDQVNDEYLAVGIGFNGGTSIIDSALVGKAVSVECDPNLAKPELGEIEAKDSETITKPGRVGGRR